MAIFRRKRVDDSVTLLSAGQRFETATDGITSWHCFSAGSHYDAERVAYGPLTGLDEHLVAPGAGFDWHAHRGVEILSWVLDGVLRHEDDAGRVLEVGPGELLHQSAGSGIRHAERNASGTAPLRFVQLTVLGGTGEPRCERAAPPLLVPGAGLLDVLPGTTIFELGPAWLYVARGEFNTTGLHLSPGDSLRVGRTIQVYGTGELLAWSAGSHHAG